jgi:phosphoribosylanthranilate isomerase
MAEVKFCGLTRPEDAAEAVKLGAGYVGAIFAGGPRLLTSARARAVFGGIPKTVRRVGVFGAASAGAIAAMIEDAGLDIVQLHADPTVADIRAARDAGGRMVWAALRIAGGRIPTQATALFAEADGVVLDARTEHALGGTGRTLPWAELAGNLDRVRVGGAKLVLAGGLTPENVAEAMRLLSPDIVDVSSGVESAPGIKDHQRMRDFVGAARLNPRAA